MNCVDYEVERLTFDRRKASQKRKYGQFVETDLSFYREVSEVGELGQQEEFKSNDISYFNESSISQP